MRGELHIAASESPQSCVHGIDARIARLAESQHGVVSLAQLVEAGLSARAVCDRVASSRLHRLYRGVFAVGHPLVSRTGWWMAATLSGGPGAVMSDRLAGAAWGLREWNGRPAVTTRTRRTSLRIDFHCRRLPPDEVTTWDGIPITTVPRTLFDLASILDSESLLRAVNEAEHLQLSDPLSLPEILARHEGERGCVKLREVMLDARYGLGITRSPLEERFARFVAAWDLPRPELNATIHVGDRFYEVDCLWRRHRLVVELQSAKFHGTLTALTHDAERKRRLLLRGFRVIEVTWSHLRTKPSQDALALDLTSALELAPM